MKLILFLSLFLWISLSGAADIIKPEVYWAQTGLDLNFLETKVLLNCQKNINEFLGCFSAINTLAKQTEPASVLAFKSEKEKNSPILGAFLKDFGPIALYSLAQHDHKKSPSANWQKISKAREIHFQESKQFLSRSSESNIAFSQILRSLKRELQYKEDDNEAYLTGAAWNAYLASTFDPNSKMIPKKLDEALQTSADADIKGIGAVVSEISGQLYFSDVLKGSAAEAVGIKYQDTIIAIDGVSTKGLSIHQAINKLRGPVDTEVRVRVSRKGIKSRDFLVKRRAFTLPNVQTKMLNDLGLLVAYIRIETFIDDYLCDKFETEFSKLLTQNPKAVILDLRDNGGGTLKQAACVGSLFLGKKLIAWERILETGEVLKILGKENSLTNLPMVTLINGRSASGSELLAAALRDYEVSWVAGDKSYGKGIGQTSLDFDRNFSFWKTAFRFYSPKGFTHQIYGITPNFYLDPKPKATPDDKFVLRMADLYLNPLPPEGSVWKETRDQEIKQISDCMTGDKVTTLYNQQLHSATKPDYQILKAQELLQCANLHSW